MRLSDLKKAIHLAITDLLATPEHVVSSRMLVSLADAYNSLRQLAVSWDARLIEQLLSPIEILQNEAGELYIAQTRSQIIERFEELEAHVPCREREPLTVELS
jgi:hypothetical protein